MGRSAITKVQTTIIVVIAVLVIAGVAYYVMLPAPSPSPSSIPSPTPTPTISPSPSPSSIPSPTPTIDTETITIATIESPNELDPAVCYETSCVRIIREVYETLVYYPSHTTEVAPLLATSWEVSPDGLEYTFKLRKGVTFTTDSDNDGKLDPFNAYCVKYSFERVIKMGMGPSWILGDFIDHIDVIDDYTVKITLKFPSAGFIHNLAHEVASIVNPNFVEAHGGVEEGKVNEYMTSHMDGTGPYILQEWKRGEREVLVANPNYWRGWEGKHVKKIIIREIPEVSTRMMLLTRGDVDIAYVPPANIPELEREIEAKNLPIVIEHEIDGKPIVAAQIFLIYFNCKRLPFSDVYVRRAFSYAYPGDQIIEKVLFGYGLRPTSLIPIGVPYYMEDIPTYEYDLDKAKEMLSKASPEALEELKKGVTFYIVPDLGIGIDGALLYKESLAKIGVNLEVREIDYSTWLDSLLQPWDKAFLMGHTFWVMDMPDPDNVIYTYAHTSQWAPQSWNPTFWGNETTDSWIEQARVEQDPQKRQELYRKICIALYEGAPWIYCYQPAFLQDMNNVRWYWVRNYIYNPYMRPTFYDIWKEP